MAKEDVRKYKKGEIIFREGDSGDNLFIIKKGKVGIFRGKRDELVLLITLGEGEFFGEMAVFSSLKGSKFRTATAQALEDTTLISVNKLKLRRILSQVPSWFITMFNGVMERLRDMDVSIKSKFRLGMGYSILQFILLYAREHGDRIEENRIVIDAAELESETCNTLGISREYCKKWFDDFRKVHILMDREKNTKLEFTDTETIRELLLYIKDKKVKKDIKPDENMEKILTQFSRRHDTFYIFEK